MTYFKKDIPGLTTPCHFPTSYKHDIVLIPNQEAFLSVLEDSAAILVQYCKQPIVHAQLVGTSSQPRNCYGQLTNCYNLTLRDSIQR